MTVDSTHPMLITQLVMGHNISFDTDFTEDDNQRGWNIQQAWAGVPDEIKSSMVFVLHPGHNSFLTTAQARKWVEDNLAEGTDLGIHMMVLWGETPSNGSDALTWLESLYQNYPNFIGTDVSELTSQTGAIPGLLKLANEYGGFHVQGSIEEANILGGKLETQSYWDSIQPFAQNFIYTPKNIHDNFDSVNAQAMGDWLSGIVGNWGPYFDGYAFYGCGIYGQAAADTNGSLGDRCSRSEPETVLAETMLDQWQQGAHVFQLENQLDIPGMDSQYGPNFYQSVLQAVRYMTTHAGPTQQQVEANVKVAFSEAHGNVTTLADNRAGRDSEPTLFDLSEKVPNALQSQDLWYYTRSSGRYYQIPRIPKLAPQSVLDSLAAAGATVIDAPYYNANLVAGDAHAAFFNGKYAAISTGDAFVQNVGDSWLIYNSNYADDISQNASVPIKNSDFSELDLPQLGASSYAALTQSQHGLDIQLNNYQDDRTKDLLKDGAKVQRDMEWIDDYSKYSYVPDPQDTALRTDTLTVTVTSEPTPTISGYDQHYTYAQSWNAATHVYTLTVAHNGVVNISLNTQPTETGWTRVAASDDSIDYSLLWLGAANRTAVLPGSTASLTADGTSLRWIAPATLTGGTADVYVDGTLFASKVAIPRAGGYVFQATGLTNQPHTIKIVSRSGIVAIAALEYVPSLEQMLPDQTLADFTYGTQAEDQSTIWGDTHWTIADGAMKILPYVSPWFGEETVYNTTAKYSDVTYEAKLKTEKGTPASLMVRADPTLKQSYMLHIDPTKAGAEVTLVRDDTTVLATNTTANLSVGTWYDVKIQATGSRIQGWVDGTQVIDFTDTSSSGRTAAGYTGVRVEPNVGGAGDFVYLDDPTLTVGGATVYSSDFSSWDSAKTWITEGPLVFGAADNRTSFNFPWEWTPTSGTWSVVKSPVETNGLSGVFAGTSTATRESVTTAGSATWSDIEYSSMVKVTSGSTAGLVFRSKNANNQYRAVVNSSTGTVTLQKVIFGIPIPLGSGHATIAPNTWMNVKVTAKDDVIVVNVNGRNLVSVHDSTFAKGTVGYYLPKATSASFDDARMVTLPATVKASVPAPVQLVGPAVTSPTQVTGVAPVYVKTAKDTYPALPATVSVIKADGSKTDMPVTWPAIDAAQLATATSPLMDGPTRGTFSVTGVVAGTSVEATATVTVMPKLAGPLTTSYVYDPANPGLPPVTFTNVKYDAGGGVSYARQVYVRWDQAIAVDATHPTQQLTGTIEDDPYEKATASVSLKVAPTDLALGKPTVSYWSLAKNPASLAVDSSATTEWKTGGAADGSFSDGTASSTNGSLCDWFYVDLGSEQTVGSFSIQWGENVATYGSMFNAPYQIQVVDGSVAPTDPRLGNSVCTRTGGSTFPTTPASQDIWTTVASGTGTLTLDKHSLAAPVRARYVRVFTNEPSTAHRYGTSVYDFEVSPN